MKFSYANHLWMSRVTGRPRKLGRVLGVDMAWKVGILSQRPHLEFPLTDKAYKDAMEEFSTSDNDKYLEFHKYQNCISEIFSQFISRKSKGKHNLVATYYVYTVYRMTGKFDGEFNLTV